MLPESPFHAGERRIQARLGVSAVEEWARKMVRPWLPEQHRAFHTALPFLVAAARDAAGRPWATLLVGEDGFVTSPDPRTLAIDARPGPDDALHGALGPGADLGLLGIDLATRRRNRLNGRVRSDGGPLVLGVEQSFGNCPQYIHERSWRRCTATAPRPATRGARLTPAQRRWIRTADTFFVASGHRGQGEHPAFGMDASHRGGPQGFVHVEGDARLVFPDYAGNNHFNTLGNLLLDPRVGLLFVDFETGGLLQLTGRARIDWGSAALARFPDAQRLVEVDVDEVVEQPGALPLRFDAVEALHSVRVVGKRRESEDVTSFVLAAPDGGALAAFEAGQHLPVALALPGRDAALRRSYSLSGPPDAGRYRITVKREPHGLASRHLHDHVEVGAILQVGRPAGDLTLPCSGCPVVLASAGVGVTPMLGLLHALAREDGERPVWFVHQARDGHHHPLAREVRALAARRPGIRTHVSYSRPLPQDRGYDATGRIDGEQLLRLAGRRDAHYFLCGPPGFLSDVAGGLAAGGVAAERIHSESFGPLGAPGPGGPGA